MHEKLKVDPEDEVMDAYSYYKCADFEPWIPKCVTKRHNQRLTMAVFSYKFLAMCFMH